MSEILPRNKKIKIFKNKSIIYYELFWNKDKILDNIIEFQKYKKTKNMDKALKMGKSRWLLDIDLSSWIRYFKSNGFNYIIID